MKLKSGQYIPALACFAGSSYKQKEVFASTSIHKVIGVSIDNSNINLELETESKPKAAHKKKEDSSFNAFDENFSLEEYYNNILDAAIPCNNGAKANRKKKKGMKQE